MRDARMYNHITNWDGHIYYIRISRIRKNGIEMKIERIRFATDEMHTSNTEKVLIE